MLCYHCKINLALRLAIILISNNYCGGFSSNLNNILKNTFLKCLLFFNFQNGSNVLGISRLLAAVMEAMCHPAVKLTAIMPINCEPETEAVLRRHSMSIDDNTNAMARVGEMHRYPMLASHMTCRTEVRTWFMIVWCMVLLLLSQHILAILHGAVYGCCYYHVTAHSWDLQSYRVYLWLCGIWCYYHHQSKFLRLSCDFTGCKSCSP